MLSADYAVARCPSITFRYRVKTAKHIVEILSPVVLVFYELNRVPKF